MTASVGGINIYPSLEDMAQLFRSSINDDMAGQSGTPGEGQIATDTAPFMLPFMNSAMRDLFSDLRIVRDQTLIFDNYILKGLPVVNGPYGIGSAAPETQVYIGYAGYFDGTEMWPNWTLPIGTRDVTRMWERVTGSAGDFALMVEAQFGLPPVYQQGTNGMWEYRGDAVWMPGAVEQVDIRIRGTLNFVNYLASSTNLAFANTYFPIQDSTNAIVDKMMVRYARRFSPESEASAKQNAMESLTKLKQEIVLRRQTVGYSRADFGGGGSNLANQL